jgi:hypothetical protein
MKLLLRCRDLAYARDLQRLQRVLEHHTEKCSCGIDCPLRMLQFTMRICIGQQASDGIEILPWRG